MTRNVAAAQFVQGGCYADSSRRHCFRAPRTRVGRRRPRARTDGSPSGRPLLEDASQPPTQLGGTRPLGRRRPHAVSRCIAGLMQCC